MNITRKQIEEWIGESSDLRASRVFGQAKNHHATVFGELTEAVQAVLRGAPDEFVQTYSRYDGWEALEQDKGVRHKSLAYRLHPDCKLVEDEKWVDKKLIIDSEGWYRLESDELMYALQGREDFVCIKVKDKAGNVLYLSSWSPTARWAYKTLEDLLGRVFPVSPHGKLTPTHVVFEGGA